MNNTIKLFMWGYQQHFQFSANFLAKNLFNQIDDTLNPSVFIIGILVENRVDRHEICLEPEDCGYSVDSFADLKNIANKLEEVDEESKVFHSHEIAQENHKRRISNKSLIEAIKKILNREDVYGSSEKFVSMPTYVDGFQVFIILEINKLNLNKHYSLTKNRFNDRYVISRSLIESTINIFLKECSIALKDPNIGLDGVNRTSEEILREAGKSFMYTISQAGDNMNGLHGLYEACNIISSLKYEGTDGLGKMIIAKQKHPNIRFTFQLKEPIEINNYRKVRKFLELANDNASIISDSYYVYGLGFHTGQYNSRSESLFIIKFISHFKWEVLHDNNSMMIVEYNQPNIPKDKINQEKLYSDLKRIFEGINENQLNKIWDISIEAIKQKHGTMLIISDNAKKESERLSKESFPLKPQILDVNLVQQITSIDGSVLINRDSECYAIGVILDGLTSKKGDSSRGARYNSAVRYYEFIKKKHSTFIMIFSEDGMINFIPNLKPQIKHSEIEDAIHRLNEINVLTDNKRRLFFQLMDYFEKIEFYLTSDECKLINELRKKIEDTEDLSDGGFRRLRQELKPNTEMNNKYYIK